MSENNGGMLGGIIVGAALGAGLALLLAPASGRKTRKRIGRRLGEMRHMADERIDGTREALKEGAQQLGDAVKEGTDVFKSTATEAAAKLAGNR